MSYVGFDWVTIAILVGLVVVLAGGIIALAVAWSKKRNRG